MRVLHCSLGVRWEHLKETISARVQCPHFSLYRSYALFVPGVTPGIAWASSPPSVSYARVDTSGQGWTASAR